MGVILLTLTALIWGTAFVAQQKGMDYLPPCAFNGIRNLIAAVTLAPCIAFLDALQGKKFSLWGEEKTSPTRCQLILGGLCCGAALALASLAQQVGVEKTTVGKASFLTTLYVIIVPCLRFLGGKKPPARIWLCVLMAVLGSYLLCYKTGEKLNPGDLFVLGCAALFSVHILVVDFFVSRTDCLRLAALQFFFCGIISLAISLAMREEFQWDDVSDCWKALLYTAVLSSCIGYTLQIVGQKMVNPVLASLLMSLESVFGFLSGCLYLDEKAIPKEIAGATIIFIAVIIAQIPEKKTKKRN